MKHFTSVLIQGLLFCSIIVSTAAQAQPRPETEPREDLSVLRSWRSYEGSGDALYNSIAHEAYRHLDARERTLAAIRTEAQWRDYIASARARLATAIGPMPEKTPLNARTVGTLEHAGVEIEKILFESRPGFLVSAALFRPSGAKGRMPVVIYLSGHTDEGFRGGYQQPILNLARKGMAVLAIDPVGQGERKQYEDSEIVKSHTDEHSYIGLQYLLIGRTAAMVRLWDCIRAVDYLAERPDIDAGRIGVVGRSGGGTMSAYLGAMDDRIAAAAPSSYITSFRRLFQSIGPQDGEQNLISQIQQGLDHGDFLLARAPKPTLVVSTTQDFFSIQGAIETAGSVRGAFEALGAGDNFDHVYDNAGHAQTPLNRKRMYAFFMNEFGISGDPTQENIPPLPEERLHATPGGDVIAAGSRTVYDFIREDGDTIVEQLDVSRADTRSHMSRVREASIRLSGFDIAEETSEVILTGRYPRGDITFDKIILESPDGLPIPALAFSPPGDGPFPSILYLDQEGAAREAEHEGLVMRLARAGYLVLTCDIPGCGELGYRNPQGEGIKSDDAVISGISYNLVFGAQLIGRSITGIQAGAIARAARYLASRDDVDATNIHAVSRGITGPALMHAVAHETRIRSAVYMGSPVSWESILDHRLYDPIVGSTIVPSALLEYDLPDLVCLAAPRRAVMIDPVDGDGGLATASLRERVTSIVSRARGTDGGGVDIMMSGVSKTPDILLLEWLSGE